MFLELTQKCLGGQIDHAQAHPGPVSYRAHLTKPNAEHLGHSLNR